MTSTRKRPSATAEVALISLKNCLVNLPASLVSVLNNANAVAQNIVIKLQYQPLNLGTSAPASGNGAHGQKSAYVGWTGMPSRRRPAPVIGRNSYANGTREQEITTLEIDATFAAQLGLTEGQRIGIFLHLDPPIAHTVNIEPLTPSDWEVIELHASFLELNLLSQVRALPNPAYLAPASIQAEHSHPLTLHLSPTSTAKVIVTSLTPAIPNSSPFAKIASDGEVIVASKLRHRASRNGRGDDRSVASTSRRSARSGGSSLRRSSSTGKEVFLLRGVDCAACDEWSPSDYTKGANNGLSVWVHPDVLTIEALKGRKWVTLSIVRPAGLRSQLDQHQMQQLKDQESSEAGIPTSKVVTQLRSWVGAPDEKHAALSSPLCSSLGFPKMVGCIIRLEAAPPSIQKSRVDSIKLYPFLPDSSSKREGLRFGGDSKLSREAVANCVRQIYAAENGILKGSVTDGMVLPRLSEPTASTSFNGGIIRFEPSSGKSGESSFAWLLGSEHHLRIDAQPEIPRGVPPSILFPTFDPGLPEKRPGLVGIDAIIKECMTNLKLCSSILLTGGIGSGKTSLAHSLCLRLSEEHLFNTTYFSCRKLVTDETRVSNIKDALTRLFMSASWCARLGGQSVVVLDDLDKICPIETELQVGNDNGRSRLITEILCSIVRYYCTPGSGIALLATAQSRDALNHIIISGHIVDDIISLKAPDKQARRTILVKLTSQNSMSTEKTPNGHPRTSSNDSDDLDQHTWMEPAQPDSASYGSLTDGIALSASLDLLDLAGRTDGFMPGDLSLLVFRARNECLARTISSASQTTHLILTKSDFTVALQNFTPTSLRNVPLTHSSTTFSSIGGLHRTRSILLETMLYPTKYAPIFAKSPLRLRSGLLLYGYPGCGKTLLASAVAGECGLNFISVKGPEILNKYIGASEKSVRDLFERAQAARPCVLFFDEFDSVAPKRGHDSTGVTDRVVNQLLTQMDGAEGLEGVYVLAATSRPDLIDPALLRPGRLDKSLLCDMPDTTDRVDILKAVSGKLVLEGGVEERWKEIANRTAGFSGADLQALMYNAHLEAVHEFIGDPAKASARRKEKMANGTRGSAETRKSSSKSAEGRSGKDDFIQFLYDPDADAEARASLTSTALEHPSIIAEKLAAIKLAKKRERRQRRRQPSFSSTTTTTASEAHEQQYGRAKRGKGKVNNDDDGGAEKCEVIITWANIERSLATTRSSISEHERSRLRAIYHEFVVGRNGEMPSGEGGREVGGRSSLM